MPILQCFCDEGGKYQKDAIVSLSGVLFSPHKLQEFDAEWRSLLASYELSSLHMGVLRDLYSTHGPKMPKDQTIDQRTSALLPFADCINRYIEVGFVEAWDVNAYIRLPTEAKGRLGGSLDPHYLAFIRVILEVVRHLREGDKASVIFDDDLVKAWDSYLHYRAVCKAISELNDKFISIAFARDDDFPGLQAADMVAFLSRHEARRKFFGEKNSWRKLFEHLTTTPSWYEMFADEQKLIKLANDIQKPVDQSAS